MCQDLSPRPTAISLRPLLLIAEDEFSAALLKGDDAVVAFNERWERLLADIDSVSSKGLDDETSALVHTVATRIATLAEVAIDLYTTSNALTSELMEQLDSSMSTLSLVDTQQGEHIRSLSQPPLPILSPSKCSPHHRKRRRCSEDTDVHPHKRMRAYTGSTHHQSSPQSFHADPPMSPHPLERVIAPNPRKRRMSDAGIPGSRHGYKRQYVGPRLHAVSDSFASYHPAFECRDPRSSSSTIHHHPLDIHALSVPLDIQALRSSSQDTIVPASSSQFDTPGKFDIWSDAVDSSPYSDIVGLDTFIESILDHSNPLLSCPISPCVSSSQAISTSEYEPSSPQSSSSSDSVPSYPVTPLLLPVPDAAEDSHNHFVGVDISPLDGYFPEYSSTSSLSFMTIEDHQSALPLYMEHPGTTELGGIFCDTLDPKFWLLASPPPHCPSLCKAVTHGHSVSPDSDYKLPHTYPAKSGGRLRNHPSSIESTMNVISSGARYLQFP